jgi:hypothetical protein
MLTNTKKAILAGGGGIRAARTPKVLLDVTGMARDSHPYPKKAISKPDKHDELRVRLTQIPHENDSCHGYRRPTLKMDEITVSAKVGKGVLTFFQPKTSYAAWSGRINWNKT